MAANPPNVERSVQAIFDFGFQSHDISTSDFAHPGTFTRLGRKSVQVDLLTDIPGVDRDAVWTNRSIGAYDDQSVAYIGRNELIRAKRAAGRYYDLGDIEKLGETP